MSTKSSTPFVINQKEIYNGSPPSVLIADFDTPWNKNYELHFLEGQHTNFHNGPILAVISQRRFSGLWSQKERNDLATI